VVTNSLTIHNPFISSYLCTTLDPSDVHVHDTTANVITQLNHDDYGPAFAVVINGSC
jgi:hypothetical protein